MNLSLLNRFQGCLYGSFLALKVQDSILTEVIDTLGHSGIISLEKWHDLSQNNPREFPLALIPLALFRHDYLTSFQDELAILRENQLISPDDALTLLVWSHLLSSIVREKFSSKNKLEFCFTSLQAFTQGTVLEEYLIRIKQAIQEGYSLERVVETLGVSELLSAIALSLYCFLDTPEYFDLSFKRASLMNNPWVLSFTGALAGAYHGFTGIPLAWRLTQTDLIFSERIRQFWSQWSGVLSENTLSCSIAIASPFVIQNRSNLKLISQEDYFQP